MTRATRDALQAWLAAKEGKQMDDAKFLSGQDLLRAIERYLGGGTATPMWATCSVKIARKTKNGKHLYRFGSGAWKPSVAEAIAYAVSDTVQEAPRREGSHV